MDAANYWFVGGWEYDRDERVFDGCIWSVAPQDAPPEAETGGLPVEPLLIADNIANKATAEFIVRACKAHMDLLKACEDMLPLLEHAEKCEASADDGFGDRLRFLRRRLAAAHAALAKARGEK